MARKKALSQDLNPIIKTDYPDPDVIRVQDVYYMISTTMYFMPGGVILRSYDLCNWEIASYVFESLDDNANERLENESSNYAGGMWAASLRYHEGTFYVVFVSHFTQTTYLFTSKNINGPWEKRTIEGYYHDCSLLFDDDGRVFLTHGNFTIHLLELDEDLKGPKKGGIDKVIVEEKNDVILGYEGSHFYKINGKYYLFLIHWPKEAPGRRTEACFVADNIEGPYIGKDIFNDDRNYCGQGVAQGGIVDTPAGKWYAVMFQDSGAVGRMPVLVPMKFEEDFPVFGVDGKTPDKFNVGTSRPYYKYEPLYTSDSFMPENEEELKVLKKQWQWNHCPNNKLWTLLPEGGLQIKTGKLSTNLTHAQNCLTQRMMFPRCEAEVTVDATMIKDQDVVGLCALQGRYGYLAVTREGGNYYLIKVVNNDTEPMKMGGGGNYLPGDVVEKIRLQSPIVALCLKAEFADMQDRLDFFYLKGDKFVKVGESHKLIFGLDHFTGARFGLFIFSMRETGGSAVFKDFVYRYE